MSRIRTPVSSRPARLCLAALAGAVVLAPVSPEVRELDRSTPGVSGSATISGQGSSPARLEIPPGAVVTAADLEWTGKDCGGKPLLLLGARRVVPERVLGARADLVGELEVLIGRGGISVNVGGPPCAASWSLHVVWWIEEPAPARPSVELSAPRNDVLALEGEEAVHELSLRNTGDAELSELSLTGDGVRCEAVPATLLPGAEKRARCRVTARSAPTTTPVTVTGRAPAGGIASDSTVMKTNGFRPSIALELEEVPAAPADTAPATVNARVRNTSPVPLEEVTVTGSPAACARQLGRIEPSQSTLYSCRVARGAVVALSASGRPVVNGVLAAVTRSARSTAVLTLAQPVSPARADHVPPLQRRAELDNGGPLESPERTAGFIGILGALVMMVSVGALSTASRASK